MKTRAEKRALEIQAAAGQPKPEGVTTEKLIVMVHDELRASNPDLQDVVNALSFKYDMRVNANDVARALRGEELEAGDYPGHEFHGNQYAGGEAHGKENEASRKAHTASANAGDKASHTAAAAAHEKAATAHEKAGNDDAAEAHRAMAKFHTGRAARFKS